MNTNKTKRTQLILLISGGATMIIGFILGYYFVLEGDYTGIIISVVVIICGIGFSLFADKLSSQLQRKKPTSNDDLLVQEKKLEDERKSRHSGAVGAIYFIAGVNIIIGILAFFGIEFIKQLGGSEISFVFGLVFLMLGLVVHQAKSKVALILALLLFSLDTLGMIYFILAMVPRGISFGLIGSFVVRYFLLKGMWDGIGAMK